MTPLLQHLVQLRQWFSQSVTWIFREATAVTEPAGGSPGWAQVLATYEVAAISDQERQQVRAAQRPERGAPVMEVHAVITAVARRARAALKGLDMWDAPPDEESHLDQSMMLIERTERELITAYKLAVLPKRQGGMFGNVMANHDPAGAAATSGPRAHSLTCVHCGAPRLSEQDFECPYCGNHMARE